MRYVSVKEMNRLDHEAMERHGIPALTLMENAGRAVAREAMEMAPRGSIAIFCGYGNNGGDGLVAARYLKKDGCDIEVFLVGPAESLSLESKTNYDRLADLGIIPVTISDAGGIKETLLNVKGSGIIIDAIFGIGVKGVLDNFYKELINKINSLGTDIIAVDVPSGLDADTGEPLGCAVKAVRTVTLGFAKIGFKNPEAKKFTGNIVLADIGLPG